MIAKQKRRLTPQQEIKLIEKALEVITFSEDESSAYEHLDLGDADANEVFGDRELGLRWGCIIELHGPNSSGKTWLATKIAAIAQQQDEHVYVAKADLERSNDDRFNEKNGIDMQRFYPFVAEIAAKIKKPDDRYEETAEQLCDKIEAWIKFRHERDKLAKTVLIIDSVTGMLVSEEDEGGLADQNMRTKVSLASFLSLLCRRWTRLAANYKVIMIFINQERMAPGVMYGSPIVTSGGHALKFYSSVRVRTRRCKNGRVMKDGKCIGLRSILLNEKNKVGGREGSEAAFKAYTRTCKWLWMTKDQAEKEAKKK